ncbi:MAG: glutamine synthetase III [Planctomycetes bacterium]|nr:glutamine synthetase III [Planctomycetota bacterium]
MSYPGADGRREALRAAGSRAVREIDPPRDSRGRVSVSAEYGKNVFDLRQMRGRLPSGAYDKMRQVIEHRQKLDPAIAAVVAHAVKEWAIENGASHFCHWFQPLTGLTAEKHDAFLTTMFGSDPIDAFGGSQLIQSEPDASSFPSGGMRSTFEARGYTAWDPSSPMFLMGATLCIPSAYLSWHGHALDEKTGLLRSVDVLDKAVRRLIEVLGESQPERVTATIGAEQEYFLVDRAFVTHRPDLLITGRSLVGAAPPKGQQLEDHYFGAIPARVNAFMIEFEHESYQLGIPVKTRHNEVAPAQFETAPIFEEAHLAADHNQLTMEVMRRVARKHDFDILFHEKPFAGINGSGKHLNWSIAVRGFDGKWDNLLEPGETPEENLRFLLVCSAAMLGVHRHAGALRAAISGAGNDHRLGANEAPPAIISAFLGTALSSIFDRLAQGLPREGGTRDKVISLGVAHLPEVQKDPTDRNRTSPFAFTGNKFEFRACGSSMAISFPVTCLNASAAEALSDIAEDIARRVKGGSTKDQAILDVLQSVSRETAPVRFEGDGYSKEWHDEAARRGLPNLPKTADALAWLGETKNHQFLVKSGIFTEEEVHARVHVRVERYLKDIDIEVSTLVRLVDQSILPAVAEYLGALSASVVASKSAGVEAPQVARAHDVARFLAELDAARDALAQSRTAAGTEGDDQSKARRYAYEVAPAMSRVRAAADALEQICGDAYWPLPRYQEMLFVR